MLFRRIVADPDLLGGKFAITQFSTRKPRLVRHHFRCLQKLGIKVTI